MFHIRLRILIYFNPRPPREGRLRQRYLQCQYRHFNPRPPRGGRLQDVMIYGRTRRISIHAPREGGDAGDLPQQRIHMTISIHAPPRGGATKGRLLE